MVCRLLPHGVCARVRCGQVGAASQHVSNNLLAVMTKGDVQLVDDQVRVGELEVFLQALVRAVLRAVLRALLTATPIAWWWP